MTELDRATVDHLLSTTRAVRRRLDLARPVPASIVEECLQLAIQAPTGSNRQGWHWVVVTDPAKRAALAGWYRQGFGPYIEQSRGDARSRVAESAVWLAEHLQDVPVLVIPCIRDHTGGHPHAGLYGSIYPAVWSFQLALRSRGLGSVLTTLHLAHEREAAELLGIPDGILQAGLLPVAYSTGGDFKPARRRPVEELTYWDEWGATR
ncbi:MAG: nitroreductase family protein [Acidimicrobiia bacterium]